MRKGFVALIVALLALGAGTPVLTASAVSANPTFSLVQVYWGTTAARGSAGPGQYNVPLTITLEYLSSPSASGLQASFALPAGFTDYDGNSTASSYLSGTVSAGQFVQLTFMLDVGAHTTLGAYTFPLTLTWISTFSGEPVQEGQTFSPTVYLEGAASISFSSSQASVAPGNTDSVTVMVSNTGSGIARDVATTASVSSQQGTVVEQPSALDSLPAGTTEPITVQIYVVSTASGSTLTLTLAYTYLDPYNNSESGTFSFGLVVSSSATSSVLAFSTPLKSLAPGATNDVGITVTNDGSTAIKSLATTVSVSPSQDGSVLSQPATIASLAAGANASLSASIYVPSGNGGAAVSLEFSATYTGSNNSTESASSSIGLYLATASGAQITVTPVSASLVAGQSGDVTLRVENTGASPIYSPTFTVTAASPLVVVANSTLILEGATVNPGQSELFTTVMGSAPTTAGGIYPASLEVSYSSSDNVTTSASFSFGVIVTDAVAQISVQSVSQQVPIGGTADLAYLVTNTGNVPLYSPSFSLTPPSSLAVTANATYSKSGFSLEPGATFRYDVEVTSGPKTTEGAYVGTLNVQYSDQFGNTHTLEASVGLVVVGSVVFVIQDETASANGTSVSVSGSLLNEGTDSAYYLTVVANVTRGHASLGGGSDYIGEVDPDSPEPFSISFTASSSSGPSNGTTSIIVTALYQNDFGQSLTYQGPAYPISLSSSRSTGTGSTTGTSSGVNTGLINDARDVVLVVIVACVVVLVGYFAVRRRRSRKAKGGDEQVI